MKAADRISRIQEIDKIVSKLQDKDWRVEAIQYTDEEDEPFSVRINVTCEAPNADVIGVI